MITPTAKHRVHHCRFPYGVGGAQRRQVVRQNHPSGSTSTRASSSRASPFRQWTYSIPGHVNGSARLRSTSLILRLRRPCRPSRQTARRCPRRLPPEYRGDPLSSCCACSHGRHSLILYLHIRYGHAKRAACVASSPRIMHGITILHPPLHACHVKEGSYGL